MNLKFELNKKYLFYIALVKEADIVGWTEMQDELWDEYKKGYQLMQGYLNRAFSSSDVKAYLKESVDDMNKLVQEGMERPEFNKLLANAKEYKKWLENEWRKNKDRVTDELKDILKIELPKDEIKVLVVGDKMKVGQHIRKGVIAWGHPEDWPNYSLVYLAHEYLHNILGKTDLEHAVIELATDNELRIKLNEGGEYFYVDGKLVVHKSLLELEKKLLSDWKKYLSTEDENVFDFIKKHSD